MKFPCWISHNSGEVSQTNNNDKTVVSTWWWLIGAKHGGFFRVWIRYMGVLKKKWYPQIIHFNRIFQHKPSILGYSYFWKHPYRFLALPFLCRKMLRKIFNRQSRRWVFVVWATITFFNAPKRYSWIDRSTSYIIQTKYQYCFIVYCIVLYNYQLF